MPAKAVHAAPVLTGASIIGMAVPIGSWLFLISVPMRVGRFYNSRK